MSDKSTPLSPNPQRTVSPKTAILMIGGIVAVVTALFFLIRPGGTPELSFEVKATYPRDVKDAYTQGLEFIDGALWEGTGGTEEINKHRSVMRRYDAKTFTIIPETPELLATRPIPDKRYFGEGITALEGSVWQLTWRAGKALQYPIDEVFRKDRAHKSPRTKDYLGQGWGLTNDGTHLIMSNGSRDLLVIDPKDFRTIETIAVTDTKGFVTNLNELEYVQEEGVVYANVYGSDRIAMITWRPDNLYKKKGQVKAYLNLSSIRPKEVASIQDHELNGIAYSKTLEEGMAEGRRRLLVTGKQWPALYVVEFELP